LLESYYEVARREVAQFRGREIDTVGDGFFAAFDGPARAIRSACAIRDAAASIGLTVRTGLHCPSPKPRPPGKWLICRL